MGSGREAGGAPSVAASPTNPSSDSPVAASTLAIDSVDGQRGRLSAPWRLEGLKAVASRPAFLARPDGLSAWRAASASIAAQTDSWLHILRLSPNAQEYSPFSISATPGNGEEPRPPLAKAFQAAFTGAGANRP